MDQWCQTRLNHLPLTPHKQNGISKIIQMLGRYDVLYFTPR